jgi:hypothetical protein
MARRHVGAELLASAPMPRLLLWVGGPSYVVSLVLSRRDPDSDFRYVEDF